MTDAPKPEMLEKAREIVTEWDRKFDADEPQGWADITAREWLIKRVALALEEAEINRDDWKRTAEACAEECGEHMENADREREKAKALEAEVESLRKERDREWCEALWPVNPEYADPVGPEEGAEHHRIAVRAIVEAARAEATKAERDRVERIVLANGPTPNPIDLLAAIRAPRPAEPVCVCLHLKSKHAMKGGVLACMVKDCACGPGCIHEGFVDRDSGEGAPIEYEALAEARKRGEADMYVPVGSLCVEPSSPTPPTSPPQFEACCAGAWEESVNGDFVSASCADCGRSLKRVR
jgi:hypothetical protein